MDTTKFDKRISELEAQAGELKSQLGTICEKWLDLFAVAAAAFWEAKAQKIVTSDSDHTKELSAAQLRKVKGEVNALIANARPTLQKLLVDDRPADWPHLVDWDGDRRAAKRYLGGSSSMRWTNFRIREYGPGNRVRGPEHLEGVLARAAGLVADPLYEAGFVEPGGPSYSRSEVGFGYYHGIEWSDAMVNFMNRYADLHEQLMEVQMAIQDTRVAKAEAEAGDIWEAA